MRPVYCLLGLPFDALDLDSARAEIVAGVRAGRREVLSTPNVNWVATARRDPEFRATILSSACSTVDGTPLLWVARLLGIPMQERVSGADLFNHLSGADCELRVFFFGGEGDVGLRACRRLAESGGKLRPVGALNPGKGSVETMSTPEILAEINRAAPDIVVVSLGAHKGQRWIHSNRRHLDAAWLTHLGAVVNFVAGDVHRAPGVLGRLGLEWAWRIGQEPGLWRRYAQDGRTFAGLLLTRVLPLMLLRLRKLAVAHAPARLETTECDGITTARLSGDWVNRAGSFAPRSAWDALGALETSPPTRIDLSGLADLDAALIGQLLVLRGRVEATGGILRIDGVTPRVRRLLYLHAAEFLVDH